MDSIAPSPANSVPPEPVLTDGQESFERVGRFELVRKIATGGMAELFLARFRGPGGFEKRCALKRILPQFVEDPDFKRMFMNEARVAAMFEHPNLVQIFELGKEETTGQFFIAMELINGMDLRQLQNLSHDRGQQIPPELASWMMAQALDGLAYAHEFKDGDGTPLNLVHRDISPQNILVSYEGAIKVVDFGIVKASSNDGHTQTGMLKGKIAYMSPEQALGDKLDARSDLFAIGICLYELIAGVKPFRGPNEIMTLRAILEQDPPQITQYAPECPRGIERAIYRALAKRRDERYQSAREFQIDLASVLRHTPMPLDRHMLGDFMKSLTEGGTDRFDATKLKIPRVNTNADDLTPRPSPRFAGSQPNVPPAATGTFTAAPMPAPVETPAAPLAPPMLGHVSVTHPGLTPEALAAESLANAKAAGVGGGKGPVIAAAGLVCAGLAGAVFYFLNTPGEPLVVTAPIAASTEVAPPPPPPPPPPLAPPAPATKPVDAPAPPAPAPAPAPVEYKERPKRHTAPKPTAPEPPPPAPAVEAPAPARAGKLTINSTPRGLTARIDGESLGTTPIVDKPVPAGTHTVTLSSAELGITKTLRVTVGEGQSVDEKLTVGRGSIQVNSRPWSEVYIDGRHVGKTPLQRPIYEGKHEVKLVSSEGGERIQTVVIEAGEDEKVLVKF